MNSVRFNNTGKPGEKKRLKVKSNLQHDPLKDLRNRIPKL